MHFYIERSTDVLPKSAFFLTRQEVNQGEGGQIEFMPTPRFGPNGASENNKAPGADSVINEFLKNGGSEVRNKLLKIMNMIFEKGEVPNDFVKTLIKPLYKKDDKSESLNNRGICLVSVGSMMLFRLRDAVDKVLKEEQCGFRKGRGCVEQVFTLRLIIEKSLCCQTPLVLSFMDFEQAFDSVDRIALPKV